MSTSPYSGRQRVIEPTNHTIQSIAPATIARGVLHAQRRHAENYCVRTARPSVADSRPALRRNRLWKEMHDLVD